jgi:uncharacterized repeat protein (TIGR03803 family)
MSVRIFTVKNALLIMTLALSVAAVAQTESTLYTFAETTTFWPNGTLLEDSSGNFYGTTRGGGTYGVGTVFEFSPPAKAGGAWTFTTLYSFVPYGTGGWVPISDLIRDQSGAFYGTTFNGGDPTCNCGAVYKLVPPAVAGGAWTESQLYAFPWDDIHGRSPANAALTLGSHGTLYGVTVQGGAWDAGVIYELETKNGKTYTETDLYSFGDAADANTPNGPILLDSKGNLYGVTLWGGAFNQGTVYKYAPATRTAAATETILYSFGTSGSSDGANPSGNLIFDSTGDIYGVTNSGGDSNGDGTVYTLTRSGTTPPINRCTAPPASTVKSPPTATERYSSCCLQQPRAKPGPKQRSIVSLTASSVATRPASSPVTPRLEISSVQLRMAALKAAICTAEQSGKSPIRKRGARRLH